MTEQRVREVERVSDDGLTARRTQLIEDDALEQDHAQTVAERVVWFIAGIILALLAFRFILSLLGANASNGFANFIYDASHPFVAPFFTLFNYNWTDGNSHFEAYTLVAMAVYWVLAYGIARLVTLNRHHHHPVTH